MAGTTLADIVYARAFPKFSMFHLELQRQDLISHFLDEGGGLAKFVLAAYMDDVVIPVTSVDSHAFVNKTVATAQLARDTFSKFKLDINLSKGEPEATVTFNGEGRRSASRALHKSQSCVSLNPNDPNSPCLRFAPVYKHTGSKTTARGSPNQEVMSRCAVMKTACVSFARLFATPAVENKHKTSAVRIYLVTKGSYNCCTWPKLSSALEP